MKKIILLLIANLLFSHQNAFSQIDSLFWNSEMKSIATPISMRGWVQLKENLSIHPTELFDRYSTAFNLQRDDSFLLLRDEEDNLGFDIYRFQQFYKGLIVEGAEQIIHSYNGEALKVIGKIVENLDIDTNTTISPATAVGIAIDSTQAQEYIWDNPIYIYDDSTDQIIDSIVFDYPTAELVITKQSNYLTLTDSNMVHAYRVKVIATNPVSEHYIYIDVNSGELFKKVSLITHYHCNCCSASGQTLYYGQQNFTSRHRGFPLFNSLLKDNCRGDYIQSYYNNSIVTSSNNNWLSVTERPAVTAHWAGSMTYDYFLNFHGRNSIDNSGKRIQLNFNPGSVNNASWSSNDVGHFFAGDGVIASELVSLDIVAHEITHGVINHSAGLIYQLESGALNESFADIFGKMVEFNYHPQGGNWELGDDVHFTGAFRSMSNPKLYNQPDTYEGDFWFNVDNCVPVCPPQNPHNDCCGVHINSGVQNHWFFLLSEGGSGMNDHNINYNVSGIGIEKAAAIAYRNLTTYLTGNSEYADARNGSIFAAMDLYGSCSNEVIQTIEAWNAVGVSSEFGFGFDIEIACPIPNTVHIGLNDIDVYGLISPFDCVTGNGQNVVLAAGNRVRVTSENLEPGQKITAKEGSYFHALINPCLSNNLKLASTEIKTKVPNKTMDNRNEIFKSNLFLFPNPSAGTFRIETTLIESNKIENFVVKIYDLTGRIVYKNYNSNLNDIIDISSLNNGTYFVHTHSNNETVVLKLVKQ